MVIVLLFPIVYALGYAAQMAWISGWRLSWHPQKKNSEQP